LNNNYIIFENIKTQSTGSTQKSSSSTPKYYINFNSNYTKTNIITPNETAIAQNSPSNAPKSTTFEQNTTAVAINSTTTTP